MSHVLQQHSQAIGAICARHGVRRLELFGSAARDPVNRADSDFDFIVEFEDRGWQGSFKRYMGLKLGLEDLLGRPVDLIELDATSNPYFVAHIAVDRRPIYAA